MTPSVDGHFDRISMSVDPEFGTEDEFRRLCATAAEYEGTVIDDIVPGHTGKGADFRLAEMGHGDYPGIYHMVSIREDDWGLLPEVPDGRDSVNLDGATELALERAGYIIGRLQRVIFYEPGVKETNWSATRAVLGVDGVKRRWVYLHYFKEGQPSINWLDPSFAGMRLVIGDALHALADLGSGGLRLDANGFLGVEKTAEDSPAWSEGHPLSEAANHLIASMIRKMGGFSFQELNLAMDDIKSMGESGADLSYDFVTRPAYHHALVTGDTEFLRLTLNLSRELGIDPASLVHALQNHDELTHELVHFSARHRDDPFTYRGEEMTGAELGERIRTDLIDGLTGPGKAYNRRFTQNGIACTTATVIAATLGIPDLTQISRRPARDDHAGPPAPGRLQRAPAGCLRALRLGSRGDADRRRRARRRPDRRRRHALDQPRRARSARRRRARPRGPDAAGAQPLRHAPGAAGRPDLVRLAAARDHRRAPPPRHRHRGPGRRPERLAPLRAGAGPRARRRRAPDHRAQLRPRRRSTAPCAPSTCRRARRSPTCSRARPSAPSTTSTASASSSTPSRAPRCSSAEAVCPFSRAA